MTENKVFLNGIERILIDKGQFFVVEAYDHSFMLCKTSSIDEDGYISRELILDDVTSLSVVNEEPTVVGVLNGETVSLKFDKYLLSY